LVRAPGFAIVAVLTLATGILGNTTIFSGVNALLFTPLPAERPEQVAQILPVVIAMPVLQSMLSNLPGADVVTFVGVSALLIAIAFVACYVPARRATRIDPIATLRAE
jgi:ABC-type lipoprotein release transport system permease subunit